MPNIIVKINENSSATIDLALTGKAVQVVGPPLHGELSINSKGISYAPNSGYTGQDVFYYKICTALWCSSVQEVVLKINALPIASNIVLETANNKHLNFDLSYFIKGHYINDPDQPLDTLDFRIIAYPKNGWLHFKDIDQPWKIGSFIYHANSGYVGPDQIKYQVCDQEQTLQGRGCGEGEINIIVNPQNNTPPQVQGFNIDFVKGSRATIALDLLSENPLISDLEDQAHNLKLAITSPPGHGHAWVNSRIHTVFFRPARDEDTSFEYMTCDTEGLCNAAQVKVRGYTKPIALPVTAALNNGETLVHKINNAENGLILCDHANHCGNRIITSYGEATVLDNSIVYHHNRNTGLGAIDAFKYSVLTPSASIRSDLADFSVLISGGLGSSLNHSPAIKLIHSHIDLEFILESEDNKYYQLECDIKPCIPDNSCLSIGNRVYGPLYSTIQQDINPGISTVNLKIQEIATGLISGNNYKFTCEAKESLDGNAFNSMNPAQTYIDAIAWVA